MFQISYRNEKIWKFLWVGFTFFFSFVCLIPEGEGEEQLMDGAVEQLECQYLFDTEIV